MNPIEVFQMAFWLSLAVIMGSMAVALSVVILGAAVREARRR